MFLHCAIYPNAPGIWCEDWAFNFWFCNGVCYDHWAQHPVWVLQMAEEGNGFGALGLGWNLTWLRGFAVM